MERLTINLAHPEEAGLARAVERLRAGGVIAFPTETLYGLGVDIRRSAALLRLYEIKGRPAEKAVAVVASDRGMLDEWVQVSERAEALIAACWPGPLTLVLPAKPPVPSALLGGGAGLGVRVPGLPLARELCRRLGAPITATSANPSSGPEPRTAEQVAQALGSGLDLLLDAGPLPEGKASTVVDLCGPRPRLLREGAIGWDVLAPYLN
jgi:L-threonylcarbamoyladenylate synthase